MQNRKTIQVDEATWERLKQRALDNRTTIAKLVSFLVGTPAIEKPTSSPLKASPTAPDEYSQL